MFTPKHISQIKIVVYTFFLIKAGDVMAVVKHWKYCFKERLWHQRQRFLVIQMSRLISMWKNICDIDLEEKNKKKTKIYLLMQTSRNFIRMWILGRKRMH